MVVVEVRVFRHPQDVRENHTYVVGTSLAGLSDPLGRLQIDERVATFRTMRGRMEIGDSRGEAGERRSILYREIMEECARASNPHCWTERVRRSSFRLGFIPSQKDDAPQTNSNQFEPDPETVIPCLVPLNVEAEINLVSFLRANGRNITNPDVVELVVIPLSQVGPGCDACCNGCAACTAAKLPDSTKETNFFKDGVVRSVLCNEIERIHA